MKHGSLFSGIGGFDLAAQWMGWTNVFHCEWNPFAQRILKHYWPNAKSFNDITTSDFTVFRGLIDILTGGFPCQPYSSAGKRLGKEDHRHLWPEMLRAVREIQPRWVIGENVSGLTNWNAGMVFEEVQADLESAGYEVTPFLLPACAVAADHRRDRIWFLSRLNTDDCSNGRSRYKEFEKELEGLVDGISLHEPDALSRAGIAAGSFLDRPEFNRLAEFPTESPVWVGDDGFPSRLDGIAVSDWRFESIKGAGNAIAPQVAMQLFRAIDQYERLITTL
ncbi:DNA cytosine methyltransferase [Dyadobacter fermentans]|uniref:DNA cytosine methyltransferase n=1 Tax=Dyadobacter fermentans TaxID=94254 RepID=UPI001CBF6C1F|nr:DNA (cytosine-5-)-methyltransferase [Dyadobacter fermentans]MBZ1362159.1 DNA (cytosine-5-)-methyltransferase [Dyadobacter fermentans]